MAGVAEFFDLLRTAFGTPTAKLFIVAGLVFLGVAIVGNITGRIQPGALGRILGGLAGPMLIVGGLGLEMASIRATTTQAQTVVATPAQTATRTPAATRTPTREQVAHASTAESDLVEAPRARVVTTRLPTNEIAKAKGIIDSMGR